jgi:erythromycin esterase-like protein
MITKVGLAIVFLWSSLRLLAQSPENALPFTASSISLSGHANVIAVGEASHGGEAMLSARNRLIHELAVEERISEIALETGYAESLSLDHFVRGGEGNASVVAAKGFTSGFGNMAGNAALLDDLRAINLRRPADKQIGIVGIDLSLAGPFGSRPTMAPVTCALEGVDDRALRANLNADFSKVVLPGLTQAEVLQQAKARFHSLSEQLASSIDHDAPEQARRCASIIIQSAAALDALPMLPADHGIPADAWRTVSKRDEAMDTNALTVLAHAGGGNVLLFAHTSHILNAPMIGGRWSGQIQPAHSMGETLHRSLGKHYLAIAQIEPVKTAVPDPTPDLLELLHLKCVDPCMMPPNKLQSHQVRIGINGNDEQLIDPATAANLYLFVPDSSNVK